MDNKPEATVPLKISRVFKRRPLIKKPIQSPVKKEPEFSDDEEQLQNTINSTYPTLDSTCPFSQNVTKDDRQINMSLDTSHPFTTHESSFQKELKARPINPSENPFPDAVVTETRNVQNKKRTYERFTCRTWYYKIIFPR